MTQRPSLYRQLRTFPNPHTARLTLQPGCLAGQRAWLSCVNVVLTLNLAMLVATASLAEWGATMALLLLITLILPVGVLLAVLSAGLMANVITADIVAQQFELVKTTTLSNWQLAGGYLVAQGWRLRTPYTLLAGGWLTIITTNFVALILLDAYSGTREYNARLFLTVTTLGVQNLGLNALLLTLTLALGLRFPGALSLRFVMPFVAFGVALGTPLLSVLVLPDLQANAASELRLFDQAPFELWHPHNLLYVVCGLLPWGLAALFGWLATRWVRRA